MIVAAVRSLEGSVEPTLEDIIFYTTKHRDGYYLLLACATLLVYDYCLTVKDEWDNVWKQEPRFNIAKFLFGLNRYYPIITYIVRVYVFSNSVLTKKICDVGLGFTSWSTVINFATVEIVLMLRIWALYDNKRKMGIFLSLLFVLAFATSLVLRSFKPNTDGLYLVVPPPQSLTQCKRSPPSELFFQYVIGLICEIVIFMLLLRKARQISMGSRVTPLLTALLRSGTLYFVIIFISFLIMIIATRVPAMYLPIADANPAIAISSVACNRLILSLRGTFHRTNDTTYLATNAQPQDIKLEDLHQQRRPSRDIESSVAFRTIDQDEEYTFESINEGS